RIGEIGERCLLNDPTGGGHEDELVFREFLDVQHDGDFLAVCQREHVDDGSTARITRTLRNFPDLEPIDPTTVRETQQVVVRIRYEELVDPVVFLHGGGQLATTPTALRAVF